MIATIFHHTNAATRDTMRRALRENFVTRADLDIQRNYMCVATLDAASLEDVFLSTQHDCEHMGMARNWTENENVLWHNTGYRLRNTDVADLVLFSGSWWLVDAVGFKPVMD